MCRRGCRRQRGQVEGAVLVRRVCCVVGRVSIGRAPGVGRGRDDQGRRRPRALPVPGGRGRLLVRRQGEEQVAEFGAPQGRRCGRRVFGPVVANGADMLLRREPRGVGVGWHGPWVFQLPTCFVEQAWAHPARLLRPKKGLAIPEHAALALELRGGLAAAVAVRHFVRLWRVREVFGRMVGGLSRFFSRHPAFRGEYTAEPGPERRYRAPACCLALHGVPGASTRGPLACPLLFLAVVKAGDNENSADEDDSYRYADARVGAEFWCCCAISPAVTGGSLENGKRGSRRRHEVALEGLVDIRKRTVPRSKPPRTVFEGFSSVPGEMVHWRFRAGYRRKARGHGR